MTHAYEKRHTESLRPYLPECMVLLKRNGSFPLGGPCTIAAFGNGVHNTVKGGTGSGEVNSRYFITVEEGLERAGFVITNKEWADRYAVFAEQAKADLRKEAKRRAKELKLNAFAGSMGAVLKQPEYDIPLDFNAQAAIYVVARLSGEGSDRVPEKGDFELTDSEVRDILALDAAYERFMLVVNSGGPIDLTPVANVGNILVMSQLGVEAGSALADVLLGTSYPSGKLATTWAAYRDYGALGDFAKRDDTRYREGIFVGYRYFDAVQKTPLFPFGFGLGYTDFSIETPRAECAGTRINVTARIANVGVFKGKETLQVYASCPSGTLVREVKSLVGFAKTRELAPGECDQVHVSFDIRDLAAYDEARGCFILEPGNYVLLAGASSADARPFATVVLDREIVTKQVRKQFGSVDFADFDARTAPDFPADDLPVLDFDATAIEPIALSYGENDCHIPEVSLLSDEQLALLSVGAFNPKGGMLSIVGNASQSVAGAAGETTMQLAGIGIDKLVMADGPAGLRLSRQFYEDEKGVHTVGLPIPESMLDSLPAPLRRLLDREPRLKEGVQLQEQFTTALPIATAIAQSFNLGFAELCGDIVGSEMELFGVDLWLAPALNIHRSVLCGRNFEYYSEDPLLSGMFAAATTRGVQGHAGKGVVIKHYAANNQETNRYANNSIVSERALREIYLRGFELCIRESSPKAIMTSYNLLNGVHTSERADLVDALCCEFGFNGIVMTDWLVGGNLLTFGSKYAAPDPAKVAAAGCNLFMPGSKQDYKAILAGLERGIVTRAQLERNVSRFLHTLWDMKSAARS